MPEVKLLAVGDISLRSRGKDNPLAKVMPLLAQKDILIGNLETVLSENGGKAEKSVTLASPPGKAGYLTQAGFDVLHLANNHIMDCGPDGAIETLNLLKDRGFQCLGLEVGDKTTVPAIVERNGIRIGFLGYDENGHDVAREGIGISRINPESIINDIKNLRAQCNAIVVSLHWGMEYVNYPSPKQIRLARSLIDAGASVVLGHHPHVLQGMEKYNDGLIAYSLGNFQFEYDISGAPSEGRLKPNQSVVLGIKIGKSGLLSYEIAPITISSDYTPVAASGSERRAIVNGLKDISRPVEQNMISWPGWYAIAAEMYIPDSLRSWRRRIRNYGFKHFLMFCKWLLSPFTLRCFFAVMTEKPAWAADLSDESNAKSAETVISCEKAKADAFYTV